MERWLQFKCKVVRTKDNAESLSASLFVETVDCPITLQKGAKLNTPVSGVNTTKNRKGLYEYKYWKLLMFTFVG